MQKPVAGIGRVITNRVNSTIYVMERSSGLQIFTKTTMHGKLYFKRIEMADSKENKSSLNVMKGIEQPSQINEEAIRKLRSGKHKPLSVGDFVKGIREGKGFGSRHLVAHGVRADYALVAETTDFGLSWFACGACYLKVSVPGVNQYTPRSQRPDNIRDHPNAIVKMAHVIQAIETWARDYEAKHTFQSPCGHVVPKVNIGAIRGGVPYRPNRTSPHCAIYVDVRILPGEDPLGIQGELQRAVDSAQAGARVETFLARVGAVGTGIEPLADEVKKAFKKVAGQDPLPEAPQEVVSMWRDNNVFNEAGIPSLTFGPPRRRDKETNRLCFDLDDLVNMANVYAEVAYAICQLAKG